MSKVKKIGERKLLIITLIACFLSLMVVSNVLAQEEECFVCHNPDGSLKPIYFKDYNGTPHDSGYMPDIDQNQDFDKFIVRTEETSQSVVCGQNWNHYPDGNASGGSITYSDTATDSCTFTFTGTSIRYIGTPSNNKGIARVWIDGNDMGDVDLYSPTLKYQQVLYTNASLSPGQHTIMIVVTGRKNPLSSLHRIDVDAFDVDDAEKEYCAPVAEANSLWWLDKKYDLGLFDTETHTEYVSDINEDGSKDIIDLVQELALLMGTNVGQTGTTVEGEQHGIDLFLTNHDLNDELYEHTAYDGDYGTCQEYFTYLEDEVKRCQDVKLDLGFWHVEDVFMPGQGWDNDGDGLFDEDPPDGIDNDGDGLVDEDGLVQDVVWKRWGGHAVTVAGVDSENFLFAISDPDNDAAEAGAPGLVWPLGGHQPHPGDPTVHNNELFASHDIYTVAPSPSPGGKCGLLNYPWKQNSLPHEQITQYKTYELPLELQYCMVFTEIEAAVIVSPIECGNGVKDPGEECDDGNTLNGDGCDDQCKIPDISVSPSSLAFGKVTPGLSSASKTVTVTNDGNGKLEIGTITIGDQFSITTDNCSGQLIAPSGSCTVDVKFAPASTGVKNQTLSIPSDDPDEDPVSVSLKGNAVKVKVTKPNGGESWKSGIGHSVTWQTSSTIAPAVATTKIYYTTNGGTTWKLITTLSGPTPGTYTWYIPKETTTKNKCKVKVVLKNAANTTIGSDMSDKVFKITP